MGKFIDLTGRTFGGWKVIQRVRKSVGKTHWLCECKCGQHSFVNSSHLLGNKSTQCKRCHNMEAVKNRPIKHGKSKRGLKCTEYTSWNSMHTRCLNKNNSNWKNYGHRNISVCKEWKDFSVFLKDMGIKPKGYSLDRIDNNGNYSKENCRWATPQQQSENKRSNVILELNGIYKTKTQWARQYKIPYTSFDLLINKNGWPLPELLPTPPHEET